MIISSSGNQGLRRGLFQKPDRPRMTEGLVVSGLDGGDDGDYQPSENAESAGGDGPEDPGEVEVDDLFAGGVGDGISVFFDEPED